MDYGNKTENVPEKGKKEEGNKGKEAKPDSPIPVHAEEEKKSEEAKADNPILMRSEEEKKSEEAKSDKPIPSSSDGGSSKGVGVKKDNPIPADSEEGNKGEGAKTGSPISAQKSKSPSLSFIEKYDSTWRIESQLGEGAFSKVYKIVKEEFDHKYYAALKVIPVPQNKAEISQLVEEGYDDVSLNTYVDAMVKDLVSEINLVRKFEGVTNIVNYEDHKIISKDDDIGYYILIRMELLQSLASAFKSNKLGEDDAIRVGLDICRALERMERYKIIHRDIKPENIFISEDGDYKLGDFGIARRIEETISGMSKKGTYNYMAPEVFRGRKYGASVDQYSLGIVLYRILNNGRIPFIPPYETSLVPAEREAAFEKRMNGTPLPPPVQASQEMSRIILKACSYEPSGRYANATEMRVALEDYVRAKGAVSDAPKNPTGKPEREIPRSDRPRAKDKHKKPAELKPDHSEELTEIETKETKPNN
jgi:serine/threonine protein kinase